MIFQSGQIPTSEKKYCDRLSLVAGKTRNYAAFAENNNPSFVCFEKSG